MQLGGLRDEIGTPLAEQLKMTLSADKTLVIHVDDGFDFLPALPYGVGRQGLVMRDSEPEGKRESRMPPSQRLDDAMNATRPRGASGRRRCDAAPIAEG